MRRALLLLATVAAACQHAAAPGRTSAPAGVDTLPDANSPRESEPQSATASPAYSTLLPTPCAVTGGRTVTCIRDDNRSPRWHRQRLGSEFPEDERFVHLEQGKNAICGLVRPSGKVLCWELGDSPAPGGTKSETGPIEKAVDVARMNDTTCALTEAGEVQCWGSNASGQLGSGSHDPLEGPVRVKLPALAIDIEANRTGACALLATRDVYCWGGNRVTDDPRRLSPTKIDGLEGVKSLETTRWARLGDGAWAHWDEINYLPHAGFTTAQQATRLGERYAAKDCWVDGKTVYCKRDRTGKPQSRVVDADDFAYRRSGACVRRTGGSVWCWGRAPGLANQPPTVDADHATRVPGLTDVQDVSVAGRGTCAVHDAGRVSCWGRAPFPRLPDQVPEFIGTPTQISLPGPATAVLTAQTGACALVDGHAQCWTARESVRDLGPASSLSTRAKRPCAVTSKGTVCLRHALPFLPEPRECTVPPNPTNGGVSGHGKHCRYERGDLRCESRRENFAFEPTDDVRAPCTVTQTRVEALKLEPARLRQVRGSQLLVGGGGACRLDRSKRLQCVSFSDAPRPFFQRPMEPQRGIVQASVGSGGVCGLRENGEVRCWGRIAPDTVPPGADGTDVGIGDAVSVHVGGTSACAIRRDRTLWCWGGSQEGERGLGGEAWLSSKVPIRIDSLHANGEHGGGVEHDRDERRTSRGR